MSRSDGRVIRRGFALPPRLARVVARALIVPTGVALAGLGVAQLTHTLLGWSDLVVNRGLGVGAVVALATYQLVPVLAQVLPFAMLIGVLVGLGHLRATHELLAIETLGVSGRRLWVPVAAVAALVTGLSLALSLWGAPAARSAQLRELGAILARHPGATLTAGTVHTFGDHRITAREVSPSGDELRGVVLWSPELGETLFSERATLAHAPDGGIDLELEDATVLLGPSEGSGLIRAGVFRTRLSLVQDRSDPRDRLPLTSFGELRALASGPPSDEVSKGVALDRLIAAEIHRRFALPLAALLLALTAIPLALSGHGATPTAGAVLGLLLTVGYYGLTQLSNGLLADAAIPTALVVWLPNGVLALTGLALLARRRMSTLVRGRGGGASLGWSGWSLLPGGRILPRYVAGTFLQLSLVCFLALLVGYLLVDVLERLDWFARYQATALEALRYYGARTPKLASRVGPLALLAAASLTVSALAQHGELLAMQACGVSRWRALAPISLVALIAGAAYFLVTDAVIPRSEALADRLKATEIKGDRAAPNPTSHFVWYRVGGSLLQASEMSPDQRVATGVTIYELDERDFPKSRIDASSARYRGHGEWELTGFKRYDISTQGFSESTGAPVLQLGGQVDEVDPSHLDVRDLARQIRHARAGGFDTTAFEVELQRRLAAPFACLLLPWIALGAAFSGGAARSASRNLVIAAVLAVGFDLAGDLSRSLGYGHRVSPAVAAWAPTVGLLAIGGLLARRALRW